MTQLDDVPGLTARQQRFVDGYAISGNRHQRSGARPDASFDVFISNCVINLCSDKARVLRVLAKSRLMS